MVNCSTNRRKISTTRFNRAITTPTSRSGTALTIIQQEKKMKRVKVNDVFLKLCHVEKSNSLEQTNAQKHKLAREKYSTYFFY